PRVRDRGGEGSERIRFSSTILPPYTRRSNRRGTLVTAPRGVGVDAASIREMLPSVRVLWILKGPEPDRFAVHVGQGENGIGAFKRSGLTVPGVPGLESVEGATAPLDVLAKLDVPQVRWAYRPDGGHVWHTPSPTRSASAKPKRRHRRPLMSSWWAGRLE